MLGVDNQSVLESNGAILWMEVERRINYMVKHEAEIMLMTPEELVKNGVCDPVKVFVKNEPHNAKKVASGMFRIIASVSLCDQIVTRLISERQNKMEIAFWQTCPSKPGMGLNDSGLAILAGCAEEILEHGDIMETDVSSWDWTVQQWELDMDAKARIKLAGISNDHPVARLLRIHAKVVGNSVFVTSDGQMYAQVIPGGQLSGDYNTSSTNSRVRVLLSLVARHKISPEVFFRYLKQLLVVSMGDDTYELYVPGIEKVMEECGHIIKDVQIRKTLAGLEFCSQKYKEDGTASPVDPWKTFFRYLAHRPDDKDYPAYLAQLMWTFRHMTPEVLEPIKRTAMRRVERLINPERGIYKSL